jgi:hypothetical protein
MMHQWFGRYQDFRVELVREALDVPENVTPEQWRWAAWALDAVYVLEEPWYYDEGKGEEEEAALRGETPAEFACRGIYCEAQPYRNKYEYQGRRKTA